MAVYLDVVFNLPINKTFIYSCAAEKQVSRGYRIVAPFGNRELLGYVIDKKKEKPESDFEIKNIIRIIDKRPVFNSETVDLASWISSMYLCSAGEALCLMIPGGRREHEGDLLFTDDTAAEYKISTMASQQNQAIAAIRAVKDHMFYLHGVTGSGKTNVFLTIAKDMLQNGKGVIYLVPEISLTHQVVAVFKAEFGSEVAILHSGFTPSERLKTWLSILEGKQKLVIGVRSAVFAPLKNLGLIIIDEEHENTYKSNFTPRYHARQVAMFRAKKEKALLLMGSATPSVEAYYGMKTGKLAYFHLPQRLSGGSMPQVEIVDMKEQSGPFSDKLITEINAAYNSGKQCILFLNRRGFSYFFRCASCGFEMKCLRCSVSLTFHKQKNRMICHYCGYKTSPPSVCPKCNSLDVGYLGFGTELIEEQMAVLFPQLTVKRVDTDTVKKKQELAHILRDFKEGKIDVLLGTQMVAKGLNFPKVSLVGIICADTSLHLPDFRASERTFNLIVQVAGRAGRFSPDGKVIIQTYQTENTAIKLASGHKIDDYYTGEIKIRKELGFPPFSRLVRLVFRGKYLQKTIKAAEDFYAHHHEKLKPFAGLLGPAECPLSRIAKNFRYHIIIRTFKFTKLHSLLADIFAEYKPPAGVYVEVDIDPVSLL
ncbi:MAG: primosomal protein N' [Spirochaetales bacterium]|nr:primosomal protein N' [Spirochaetales bacterium]